MKDNQAKPDGHHVRVMRDDYTGQDNPLAAIATVRPDGKDLTVFPMVARGRLVGGEVVPAVGFGAHPAMARGQPLQFRRRFHDPELEAMARLAARYDLRMAWGASAIFAFAMLALMQKNGQNLGSDAYKAAVYCSNTMTPDKTVTTATLTTTTGPVASG